MSETTLNTLPAALLQDLQSIVGDKGYRAASERDTSDARGRYKGTSQHVFRPADTATTARLVQRCSEARLPIIPIGGATGLVAGHIMQEPTASILLSTERMNNIRSVSRVDRQLVAEAGVILANAQSAAADADMLFPLSLAAEGSCSIGGNLATNAGGVQVLRYGNTRDLVLGVEAVMPDGSVLNGLSPLRKNNTGYDIKNLLIGSEGSLGLITAASLKLFPAIKQQCTALCPLQSPAHALTLLSLLQAQMGEFISAFELISGQGLEFLAEHFPQLPQAVKPVPQWSVLIELGSSAAQDLQSPLENALGLALEQEIILDAVICQSSQQRQQLWDLREHIPLANAKVGAIVSFDISLPLSALSDFIQTASARIKQVEETLRINCFGHVGDGNLHFNIFPPVGCKASDYTEQQSNIRENIYDLVTELGGSFSAEHGVGRDKTSELQRYADPTRLALMRAIKNTIDPLGIFNPGAVITKRA